MGLLEELSEIPAHEYAPKEDTSQYQKAFDEWNDLIKKDGEYFRRKSRRVDGFYLEEFRDKCLNGIYEKALTVLKDAKIPQNILRIEDVESAIFPMYASHDAKKVAGYFLSAAHNLSSVKTMILTEHRFSGLDGFGYKLQGGKSIINYLNLLTLGSHANGGVIENYGNVISSIGTHAKNSTIIQYGSSFSIGEYARNTTILMERGGCAYLGRKASESIIINRANVNENKHSLFVPPEKMNPKVGDDAQRCLIMNLREIEDRMSYCAEKCVSLNYGTIGNSLGAFASGVSIDVSGTTPLPKDWNNEYFEAIFRSRILSFTSPIQWLIRLRYGRAIRDSYPFSYKSSDEKFLCRSHREPEPYGEELDRLKNILSVQHPKEILPQLGAYLHASNPKEIVSQIRKRFTH